jgi:hypothetical protein
MFVYSCQEKVVYFSHSDAAQLLAITAASTLSLPLTRKVLRTTGDIILHCIHMCHPIERQEMENE